jgi:hypothetical protein
MPLSMDMALEEGLNPARRLPFSDAPLPNIYTSLFRQLWGTHGGGVDLDISMEIHNTTDEVEEQDGPIGHYTAIGDHQGLMDEAKEQDGPIGQDKAIGAHQGSIDKAEERDGPIGQDSGG